MKKIIALLLVAVMVLSLAACGTKEENTTGTNDGTSAVNGTGTTDISSTGQQTTATEGLTETGELAAGYHYKEEIIIAMADEFTTIDPMETTAETNQIVQDCTHDLLTDTNLATMQNEGELVESWTMEDPTHWTFILKSNVTFHDGTILDTEDVYFTLMDRAPQHSCTSAYAEKIKEFTIVDDLTFKVELYKGDVDFNYVFAANSLAILSKEAFETMPEEEAVKIGTGPWMYEEFVPGDYVSLVRFEGSTLYPVPNTQRLVFKMIPEASARMIALENGEVDVIMSPNATDYARLIEDENLQLITEVGRGQHYVGFNLANPDSIVTNPKFRLAVAKALDKEEICIAVWDGYATPSTNIHCRDMGYYNDIEGIAYDPEGAQALFDELGCNGMTISLVTTDSAVRTKFATNVQSQLKKYGINVDITQYQTTAFNELQYSTPGETSGVEMLILSWTPGKNADYMYRNTLYSSGGRNGSHLNDAEIDELIDAAAGETDTTKRGELYLELQNKLVTEIIPWIPCAQATLTFGAAAGVTGAKIHPGLVHQFKECERIVAD